MGLYSNYLLSSVSTHLNYSREGCIENYFSIEKKITSEKDSPLSKFLISEKCSSNKLSSSEKLIPCKDKTNNSNTSLARLSPISVLLDNKQNNKEKKIPNKDIKNKGLKRSISNDITYKYSKTMISKGFKFDYKVNIKRSSSLVKIEPMSIECYYNTNNSNNEINISSSNNVTKNNMLYRNSYSKYDNDTQLSICKNKNSIFRNNDIKNNDNIYDTINNNKYNNITSSTSEFNSSNTNISNISFNYNIKNNNIYNKNDNNNYKCHALPSFSSNLTERMNILLNNRMNICNYSSISKDTIQSNLNDNLDNYKKNIISSNSNNIINSCPYKRNSIDSCETNHTNLSSITKTTTNHNNSIPEVQSNNSHSNILDSSQDSSHSYINESSLFYGNNNTLNDRSYDTNLSRQTTSNLNLNDINMNTYNFIQANNKNYYNILYSIQDQHRDKFSYTAIKEGPNTPNSNHIIYQQNC